MNLVEKVMAAANFGDNNAISPTAAGTTTTIPALVNKIMPTLGLIAGAIAVIFLIYSGILYLTAAGNEANAKKGQQGIINAIIGIVIIGAAYTIISLSTSLLTL